MVNRINCLRRIEHMESGIMFQEKPAKQFFVETVHIVGQFIKAVLLPSGAEIQGCITERRMLINQKAFALSFSSQFERQMQRQRCNAGAAFRSNKSDDFSANSRPSLLFLLGLNARQSV